MGEQVSTPTRSPATLERRAFVATLLGRLPDALVVAGLGSAAYDVFAAGDRDTNYYLWGAMGGAAALGLGLALAQPTREVVVLTGDGEQLMGLGALATIGAKRPRNLSVVVLDNGHFGETGMQRSHTGLGVDLVAVARGCGIERSLHVHAAKDVDPLIEWIHARGGPVLAQVAIQATEPPRVLPPRDGPYVKNRFRAALGLEPF
jgi:thiamine pyrophosphate-dependent acetolactate synthase large subunit-like protein